MATKKDEDDVQVEEEQVTPPSSPVPPPVNIGVGGQNWTKTATPPTERTSIADDPTGESNAQ
jgi:hypothetical protein